MKHNKTIENVLEQIGIANEVYSSHKIYVTDLSMVEVYRLCREDIIKNFGLNRGEYNMFYAMTRGRR